MSYYVNVGDDTVVVCDTPKEALDLVTLLRGWAKEVAIEQTPPPEPTVAAPIPAGGRPSDAIAIIPGDFPDRPGTSSNSAPA